MHRVLRIPLFLMLSLMLINAKVIRIYKSDGMVEQYYVSDVKKMTFHQTDVDKIIPGPQRLMPNVNNFAVWGFRNIVYINLVKRAAVSIDVFNMRGCLVKHINLPDHEKGRFGLALDNGSSRYLCAGSYIVRVHINKNVFTQRIIINR